MEPATSTQALHKSPIVKVLGFLGLTLLVSALSTFTTYYFLTNQNQSQFQKNETISTPVPTASSEAQTTTSEEKGAPIYDYSGIDKLENPQDDANTEVKIVSTVGDITIGTVSSRIGGGSWHIWKKSSNSWVRLQSTQYAFSCKILLENKIPPTLNSLGEECNFYENECVGYEKECQRQKETNKLLNYTELYKAKYAQ